MCSALTFHNANYIGLICRKNMGKPSSSAIMQEENPTPG